MKTLKVLAAVAAFAASAALAPVSLAGTMDPDMQLMCSNGEPAVLTCEYVRDANGNIVVGKCTWNC